MPSPGRARVRACLALGAALSLLPFAPADATASPTTRAVTALTAQVARPAPPPSTQEVNGFTVSHTRGLTTITWQVPGRLPSGGARPEFVVDGDVVGAPIPSADGSRLVLRRTGLDGIGAADLGTVLAGRRIDLAGLTVAAQDRATGTTAGQTSVARPTAVLSPDPGASGRYRTRRFGYHLPGLRVPGLAHRVETLATVVAPVRAPGRRPVVVLLHGRHETCYAGRQSDMAWPCADGEKPIPSQNGYLYLQKLLASQGYVTVSIAANGVNAQDDTLPDGGAAARSAVVRHHLDVLAGWNAGTGPRHANGTSLKGTLDLTKVMLVGHSRGGEGVNRAAIDVRASDPYRIAGQVLIAPTDFGRQVAPAVPTTVLLPFCDGDVSDLQGQQYVDQGRTISSGDRALRTAVLVMGANHNYFNTQWTPGTAAAPASDDWYDAADPTCGTRSRARLTAAQQRSVGAAYVAAAAQTYLSASASAVKLLDGTPIRAASAGRAIALTEAVGGRRQALAAQPGPKVAVSGRTTATPCVGYVTAPFSDGSASGQVGAPACTGLDDNASSPHWLPDGTLPSPRALRVRWTAAGGGVTIPLPGVGTARRATDIGKARAVDLRVAVDGRVRSPRFDVVLTDSSGRSQAFRPVRAASALPSTTYGTHLWAQTVRVVLPKRTRVDRARLVSMTLRPTSSSGLVYLLDAHASRSGLAPSTVSVQSLPRIDVRRGSVRSAVTPDGVQTTHVVLPITGTARRTSSVWVSTTSVADAMASGRAYTLTPGQRSLDIPVQVLADGTWSADPLQYVIAITPLRDVVTGNYVNTLDVTDGVAPPTLTALDPVTEVIAGDTIRWTLRLSAPIRGWYSTPLQFVAPDEGVEATSDQVLRSWASQRLSAPWDSAGRPVPLSRAGAQLTLDFGDLSTTAVIEIPTTGGPRVGDRRVQVEVLPDGAILTEPLALTATIRSGG